MQIEQSPYLIHRFWFWPLCKVLDAAKGFYGSLELTFKINEAQKWIGIAELIREMASEVKWFHTSISHSRYCQATSQSTMYVSQIAIDYVLPPTFPHQSAKLMQYPSLVNTRSRISHQTIVLAGRESWFLVEGVSILGHLLDFSELEPLLALSVEVVYCLGLLWGDTAGLLVDMIGKFAGCCVLVDLGEMLLLVWCCCEERDGCYDSYRNDWRSNVRHHLCCIFLEMCSRRIVSDALTKLRSLFILALLTLVGIVTLPAHDVVGNGVRRLSNISEFFAEAIRRILLVVCVVSIATQLTVEIEAAIVACHERTIDGDLVKVHSDVRILGVKVEEHTELEQRVGRASDTRGHATEAESGLFDVALIVLWGFIED